MVLNIHMICDARAPVQFEVTVFGKTEIIDNERNEVSFCVDKAGTYEIRLVQKETDEAFSRSQKIMYLLLLPIIGLFSGLSVFGNDNGSIFEKINPYLISQKTILTIDADTQIDVTYVKPEYNKKQMKWGAPNLIFSLPVQTDSIEFIDNDRGFDHCYLNFKRSFLAICFDVAVLFLFIAFYALYQSERRVFAAFLVLSVSISVICLLTLVLIKKTIKKMQTDFKNK